MKKTDGPYSFYPLTGECGVADMKGGAEEGAKAT
jgi:hypothetical protein